MVSEHLRSHYGEYYDGASEWRRLGAVEKSRNIARGLGPLIAHAGPRVLEIGCGEGSVLERMSADLGWEVEGVEISSSGASAASARGLRVQTFDGCHVPVPDDSFDAVVMTHVVEHLEDPRSLIREATRVAPIVFIEVPMELTMRTSRNFEWTPVGHINLYNALLIRHLVQSTGLSVVAEFTTNPRREVFAASRGWKGAWIQWPVRELALRAWPSGAQLVFVYHRSLVCTRPRELVET